MSDINNNKHPWDRSTNQASTGVHLDRTPTRAGRAPDTYRKWAAAQAEPIDPMDAYTAGYLLGAHDEAHHGQALARLDEAERLLREESDHRSPGPDCPICRFLGLDPCWQHNGRT